VSTNARRSRWSLHTGAIVVLVIGLLLTASIAIGTRLLRNDNEDRLLGQRVNEASTVASTSIGSTSATLGAAAALAQTTNGDIKSFEQVTTPLTATRVPYVSASLWPVGSPDPHPLTVVGMQPKLARQSPERIRAVLDDAAAKPGLSVVNLLGEPNRRLGYADTVPGSRFVVYTEAALPRSRKARIAKNSAFADFDYALYLGTKPNQRNLLASSTGGTVPGGGRRASVAVPFGDQKILLVLAPRVELGGTLLLQLPWALAGLGILVSISAAMLVEWLSRRREHAETLAAELEASAAENARLLADQRTVASTLQHSLLPERLPDVSGLELAVRYIAGVEGVDIGGDWYDVLPLDDGHLLFVIGDVSGRGLRAATIMASLRYAIHAYAAQGDPPASILAKLSRLLDVERDGAFATVLCGTIDTAGHRITMASAGHLPPLLVVDGAADFVRIKTGLPVGVDATVPYESVTITVPEHGTVLVYTDGLIERRGEGLDVGLERLRGLARGVDGTIDHLLGQVVEDLTEVGADDDTAILGLRWRT
jgi:serine phosphatase RsbU (regulator of sigma subunit)